MSAHTLPELYETLTSGGTFRMKFNCKEEANNFRAKIATHKHRTEKELKLMGVIEVQSLSMSYDADSCIASFHLTERKEQDLRTYDIIDTN
jgi:hypothetical protein